VLPEPRTERTRGVSGAHQTPYSAALRARLGRRRRRPAFTLIEILVIMTALTFALGLLVVVLGGALKIEQASTAAVARLETQRDLADQFRADVAGAAAAPGRWQDEVAGPACVVLRLGKDRHIVYRREGEHLVRLEYTGDQPRRRDFRLGSATEVEFGRPAAGGRLLTLRLISVRRDGGRAPSAEIAAALGGDLQ
jgi:hypothetical protein